MLAGLQNTKAAVLALATVQSAEVKGRALFVQFRNAGKVCWYGAKAEEIPPYGRLAPKSRRQPRGAGFLGRRELVGNRTALLINQQYDDESRPYCRQVIQSLAAEFQANDYAVTVVNGSSVTASFLGSGLGGYGAVFFISHGCYDGTNTWLTSGQTATVEDLFSTYFDDWVNDRVSLGTIAETRSGVSTAVRVLMISQKFISARYASGSFPHSLVYLVACQSFTGTSQLAQAFASKGTGAVVGWDETNCRGQSTGWLLFDGMLGGANLQVAYDGLPGEARNDNCESPTAHLLIYPETGGTLQLVDTATVSLVITSPENHSTVGNRVVTLSGKLRNARIRFGTVEANGVTTSLKTETDSTFSQPLVLQPGANSIRVNCYGMKSDSTSVFASSVVAVTGQFAAQALWTELRWNTNGTDIDFHLLPPNTTSADLWTSKDCYFGNETPSWGAVLDVDNTAGYGPEHITMDSVTVAGTYHLYVHYYGDHGGHSTLGYVSVAANGRTTQSLGPYALERAGSSSGDVWEVCTITYPGGTITPVNQLIQRSRPRVVAPNEKVARR